VRAVVIDPVKREVRDQEVDGKLAGLQAVVGGRIEAIYPEAVGISELGSSHLYVNEEGRLLPEFAVQRWSLRGWPEAWLCGPAIVLADNGRGGEAEPKVTAAQVRELVTFL
jgi:hypothetical protein